VFNALALRAGAAARGKRTHAHAALRCLRVGKRGMFALA